VAAGFALDATNVYSTANGRVIQASKTGGATSAFYLAETAQSGAIASDGSYVYYVASDTSGDILRVAPSTNGMEGVPQVVAHESVAGDTVALQGLATDGADLYWVEQVGSASPLFAAAIGSTTTTQLTGPSVTSGIVADTSGVYFFEGQNLYKYTRSTNVFTLLATTDDIGDEPYSAEFLPAEIALGGGNVCWVSSPDTLWCASSTASSTPQALATGLTAVFGVAVDSTNAYVTGSGDSFEYQMNVLSLAGSLPTLVSDAYDPAYWVAADPGTSGNVYWITSDRTDTLYLIAKP